MKEINLINLTPHEITIVADKNIIIPPSGTVARCQQQDTVISMVNGILITKVQFGEVYDLPPSEENTLFIVSRVVAEAVKGQRNDVLVPSSPVRDSKGKIIGCKALSVIE